MKAVLLEAPNGPFRLVEVAMPAPAFTLLPLLTGVGREHHGEILTRIAALVEGGRLSPRLDPRTFGLADVDSAHAAVASGGAAGKIVVTVVDGADAPGRRSPR